MDDLITRLEEFEQNVWIHTDDAFQQQFDTATDLNGAVAGEVALLLSRIDSGADEDDLAIAIAAGTREHGVSFLTKVIQLVGLTRNKLVTDIDAIGRAAGLDESPPSTYQALPGKAQHWPLACKELASRFRAVFGSSAGAHQHYAGILETVNRATWPGYIRQERAKRSGHQAEARLARISKAVGLKFAPEEKAEQDIAPDVDVGGESFDLVYPDTKTPKVCIISTVHTANIGQYGESKDAGDIAAGKAALQGHPGQPMLVALADGLGFRSNRAGLEGVLSTADEFCQFRTIWKAVVIAAAVTHSSRLELWLPDPAEFSEFLDCYQAGVELAGERPDAGVEAGDGIFIVA